jgi:hypothetical protein
MTRTQAVRHWNKLKKRAVFSPHGKKRERERDVKKFAHELLKAEIFKAA